MAFGSQLIAIKETVSLRSLCTFPIAFGSRVGLPVHEELVLMVAMGKLQPDDPAAVRHPRHRMGRGLPLVEVANERDALGLRRAAEEIHQVERPVAGVPAQEVLPGLAWKTQGS